jgi:hypothetical protein
VSGWVHAKLVAKEDYYAIASDTYTVFLRERTSLAGTTQHICTTDVPVSAQNMLTSFRPETPIYNYTPIDTSTQPTNIVNSKQESIQTSFRPTTPVYNYTSVIDTVKETSTVTEVQKNTLTSFRPEAPIFKYIVDAAIENIDNPIVQKITGMMLTSFRPETPIYNYTPVNTLSTDT